MTYNPLTEEEQRVIEDRETEMPFSGEYVHHTKEGTYLCKRCNTPLYYSSDKFDAHCGWPAFDKEIESNVRYTPDPDGRRTEISCKNCDAHLGHVFYGEHLTPANTRHCVNSISLKFLSPKDK